jgi:hypothetical protein
MIEWKPGVLTRREAAFKLGPIRALSDLWRAIFAVRSTLRFR